MQGGKRQIDPATYNNANIDELSEQALDIPIKKTKQIKEILKLRAQEQKILQQAQAHLKKSQINSEARSRTVPQFQKKQSFLQNNNSYIMECILRSLGFRKLAIDDIAQIFEIEAEVVEEVDRFRRLREFEAGEDAQSHQKLEILRSRVVERVESGIRRAAVHGGGSNNNSLSGSMLSLKKSSFSNYSPFSPSIVKPQRLAVSSITHPQHFDSNQYTDFNSVNSLLSQPQQNSNLFQYQRLLRSRPPHRLDNKTIAIVEILKKRPNLMQRDIIKVLAEEYGIAGMTQTSVSRYIRRIYDMKKHVDVILQAQKEGFVVL